MINTGLTLSNTEAVIRQGERAGLVPLDIDVTQDGSASELFTLVMGEVDEGDVHYLLHGTAEEWHDFTLGMKSLDGRWLDFEIGYFNGGRDLRYSGLFLEDGDNYAFKIDTWNTDEDFQELLREQQDRGMVLVDFEAYRNRGSGATRYAGLWVNDPNQPKTTVYYGLEQRDVSDLLRPLAGKIIDFERYFSTTHNEDRYALILAMLPNGPWGHYSNMSRSQLLARHRTLVSRGAELIDLESRSVGGVERFDAVWGAAVKSMNEVPAIAADPDPEPLPSTLQTVLSNYEAAAANGGGGGTVAVYAKNLRTGQSLGYRQNRPVYLASTIKIATHIKFWREVQKGHLHPRFVAPFSSAADAYDPWWVDGARGGTFGLNATHLGQKFTLDRYDRAMMDVSDNAATNLLIDHPSFGLSFDAVDLNEWLAGLDRIGQGFTPFVSIHDVDRTIMWQGQVERFPDDESLFLAPGWTLEPYFGRNAPFGSNTAPLRNWLDNNRSGWSGSDRTGLPDFDSFDGHQRHYDMSLNTGTAKAMTLLLEGLANGDLLDPTHTRSAIERMTSGTQLDDCGVRVACRDSFPVGAVDVFAKGGTKGGASRPRSNAALFDMGPDTIAVTVVTEDHGVGAAGRTWQGVDASFNQMAADVGLEVVQALGAELRGCTSLDSGFSSGSVRPGNRLDVRCQVRNAGGGDAFAFAVGIYASTNATITQNDRLLGYAYVNGLKGGEFATATLSISFPWNISPGHYFVGALVDQTNAVGEWDESNNSGLVSSFPLTVLPPFFNF